jgi:predicted amidohydrolase
MPNMHLIRQLVEKTLRAAKADLVVLPEVFNGVSCDYDPRAGEQTRQFLATLAKACQAAVIGGSIDYAHEDGTWRNTCFVIDDQGREVGSYHKRVMFTYEQDTRKPGNGPGIFELAGFRVGVMICADLWEPGYLREYQGRIDLLCVPAKTTVASEGYTDYARRLWWNLAMTRAVENALPIVVSDWPEARHEAAALVEGTRVQSVHFTSGGANITDPSKRPRYDDIQHTLHRGQPGVLSAAIDLDAVARFRDYRRSVGLLPDT